jgi:hypothetical protein
MFPHLLGLFVLAGNTKAPVLDLTRQLWSGQLNNGIRVRPNAGASKKQGYSVRGNCALKAKCRLLELSALKYIISYPGLMSI